MYRTKVAGIAVASVVALATVTALVSAQPESKAQGASQPAKGVALFTDRGELERPKDYRTWVYVGSPLTPNDMNEGHAAFPEFHNVYIDPASYDHYKTTGEFRDGTVLVKELVSVGTKSTASGKGYFEGEFIGVEAMVKDKARFAKEPSNWGFFRFTDEEAAASGKKGNLKKLAVNVAANCTACHAQGEQDRVFTQHYPVLRAAKGAKRNSEND